MNIPIWPDFQLIWDFTSVQIICQFHKDPIKTKQAMLRIKSNMMLFGTQVQVIPKWRVRSGQTLNLSMVLWLAWFPASLKMIGSKVKSLSSGQYFFHYKSMGKFFIAQGQVTPKWIVRSGLKSNPSKILWLSSLPASLTKLPSKMMSSGQHFPHYKCIWAISKGLKGK